jgi:hypothetical protein
MIYSVRVKNEKLIDLLFAIAKQKGIDVCDNYRREKSDAWEHFQYNDNHNEIVGSGNDEGKVVSIEEMIDLLENPMKSRFVLNREYTAIIDRGTKKVIVGCQEFDFKVIKELAEFIFRINE